MYRKHNGDKTMRPHAGACSNDPVIEKGTYKNHSSQHEGLVFSGGRVGSTIYTRLL